MTSPDVIGRGLISPLDGHVSAGARILGLLGARSHRLRKIVTRLDDAVLLLLVVFLFPLVIILIGAPIALCVRIIMAIAHRL